MNERDVGWRGQASDATTGGGDEERKVRGREKSRRKETQGDTRK